jgi:Fe-S-cluster containining protein
LGISVTETAGAYTKALLIAYAFPALFMKTKQGGDCVFLNDGKCSVYNARPRACRNYPLGTNCGGDGEITSFIVSRKSHPFKQLGGKYTDSIGNRASSGKFQTVKHWNDTYFTPEERETLKTDFQATLEIAKIISRIPGKYAGAAEELILSFKYLLFNHEQDFQTQFILNLALLHHELSQLPAQ